jgi:hypothetical protein
MRPFVFSLAIAALLLLYFTALYAMLHPKVSAEYRAYYIDHSVDDWHPAHYAATPEQGIALRRNGLPEFVKETQGFYPREVWGRWTRAKVARILMNREFSGPTCVVVTARPSRPELGKQVDVFFGNESRPMRLTSPEFSNYLLDYDALRPVDELSFRLPELPPKDTEVTPGSRDYRRLGISMTVVRIFSSRCESVAAQTK